MDLGHGSDIAIKLITYHDGQKHNFQEECNMKTSIASVGALVSLCLICSAHAEELNRPADNANSAVYYNCELSGAIHGASVAIIFGGEVISGPGVLSCVNQTTNQNVTFPVKLSLIGGGIGFDISIIRNIAVHSSNIKVADPNMLVQSFGIGATAGATLIQEGVAFDVAITATDGAGLGFEVGLSGQDALGLGVHLYAMTFHVERM
jgi:hypothetical protein